MDPHRFTPATGLPRDIATTAARQAIPAAACNGCGRPLGDAGPFTVARVGFAKGLAEAVPVHRGCADRKLTPGLPAEYRALPIILPLGSPDRQILLPLLVVNPSVASTMLHRNDAGEWCDSGLLWLPRDRWGSLDTISTSSTAVGELSPQGRGRARYTTSGWTWDVQLPDGFMDQVRALGCGWVALTRFTLCDDIATSSDPLSLIRAAIAADDFLTGRVIINS